MNLTQQSEYILCSIATNKAKTIFPQSVNSEEDVLRIWLKIGFQALFGKLNLYLNEVFFVFLDWDLIPITMLVSFASSSSLKLGTVLIK